MSDDDDDTPQLTYTRKNPLVAVQIPDHYSYLSESQRSTLFNKLTLPQWRFVQEYMIDFDHIRAYREVYSVSEAVPDQNVGVMSRRLLRQPKIQAAMAEYMRQYGERLMIKKDTLVAALWEIVTGNEKAADRIKATELMAKMLGLLEDSKGSSSAKSPKLTVQINGPQSVTFSKDEEEQKGDQHGPIVDVEPDD